MKWKPVRVGSKFNSKIPTAIRLSCSSLLATEKIEGGYETNLRLYSSCCSCGRPIRGDCACCAGGRERFRTGGHYSLRADHPTTLGYYGRYSGADRRGDR